MTLQQKIDKAIENNNLVGAKKLLAKLLEQEHRVEWEREKRVEFNLLFPQVINESETEEEYNTRLENYISFSDWLEETEIESDAVYTEEGVLLSPLITRKLRPYMPLDVTDAVNSHPLIVAKEEELRAKSKANKLDTLKITSNSVAYDAHGRAIGNMSAVVAVANAKFNKALAYGESAESAYAMIFKSKIGWRNAENSVSMVQIESVVEALEKSMLEVSKVVVDESI